jgi:hypothetical protein
MPATSLVGFTTANEDNRIIIVGREAVNEALGTAGWGATDHADGLKLLDLLGFGHKQGHGPKGLPAKVHVQPGQNDPHTRFGQLVAYLGQLPVEELSLVHRYYGGVRLQELQDLTSVAHRHSLPVEAIV